MEIEKVEKLIPNLHNRTKHAICIKNLKQALNHGLVLKKVRRIIKFNQKAWLKSYIDMNTELKKKKQKMTSSSARKIQFLEKLWQMLKDIEILNL